MYKVLANPLSCIIDQTDIITQGMHMFLSLITSIPLPHSLKQPSAPPNTPVTASFPHKKTGATAAFNMRQTKESEACPT